MWYKFHNTVPNISQFDYDSLRGVRIGLGV